jgi:hypothetical protein
VTNPKSSWLRRELKLGRRERTVAEKIMRWSYPGGESAERLATALS